MDTSTCVRRLLSHLEQHGGRHRRKEGGASADKPAGATTAHCAGDASQVNGSLNASLQPIQREQLRAIFLNFCGHGSDAARCLSCMELLPFMLFAREAGIITSHTGQAQLHSVFKHHAAAEGSTDTTEGAAALTFQSWLDTLSDVALQSCSAAVASQSEAALELACKLLSMRHLFAPNQHLDDPWLAAVLDPCLARALFTKGAQAMLRGLFVHYAGGNSSTPKSPSSNSTGRHGSLGQGTLASTGSSNGSSGSNATGVQQATPCIDTMLLDAHGCARLGKDLHLVPDLITNMELLQCAHLAKTDTERGQDAKHPAPLSYPEFVEMVTRCALVVHKWQHSGPGVPTSSFSDSYSSHAKQAWLQSWGVQGSSTGQAAYSPSWVGSPGGSGHASNVAGIAERPHFQTMVVKDSALDKEVAMEPKHQERFDKMVAAKAAAEEQRKVDALLEVVQRRDEILSCYAGQTMRRKQLEHLAAQDAASMQVHRTLVYQAASAGLPPSFFAQDAPHTHPLAQTLEALDWTFMRPETV